MFALGVGRTTRSRVLSIVFIGAILPLALVAAWLARGGVRAGEDLLRAQLLTSLDNIATSIDARWAVRRGDLLWLANSDVAARVVAGRMTPADTQFEIQAASSVNRGLAMFAYYDLAGRTHWSSLDVNRRPGPDGQGRVTADIGPVFRVEYPVRDSTGARVGALDADVRLGAVIPSDSAHLVVPGSALAVRDARSGAVLADLASGIRFAESGRQRIGGQSWIVATKALIDPALEIELGAPAGPYVAPFDRAARVGLLALILVTIFALLVTSYLTTRLSESVTDMVDAADAVARGDLHRQVVTPTGPVELTRLAEAFNAMTESLRRTLTELSERRALAAVGEFAAALSHEVRNALTPVSVDLERAQERLSDDSKTHALVTRALSQVTRLDSAVTGALAVARSGHVDPRPVNVRQMLTAAIEAASPAFAASGSSIRCVFPEELVEVRGDPDGLKQLFVNLLMNAAQAVGPGGATTVNATVHDLRVAVSVEDDGRGIAEEHLARVTRPFFTTRVGGTGLGLPIARQIAVAHGGTLDVSSYAGRGTTVTVSLPTYEPPTSSSIADPARRSS